MLANEKVTTTKKSKTYFSYKEALAAALAYFNGDELAATTWLKKYAIKLSKPHRMLCTGVWLFNLQESNQNTPIKIKQTKPYFLITAKTVWY